MKKQEYLELLKAKVFNLVKELHEDDPDERNEQSLNMAIQNSTQVNELIGILADLAFDVPGAMRFILEPVVEGLDDEFFCDNIPMQWDT